MTKGSYKTSAIFCHAAIGSLATSALAALLIFEQAHSTTCFLFSFPFLSFVSSLLDYQSYRLACIFPAVLMPRLIESLTPTLEYKLYVFFFGVLFSGSINNINCIPVLPNLNYEFITL